MSTPANGVSLLGLQDQMNANMAAVMAAVNNIAGTVAKMAGGETIGSLQPAPAPPASTVPVVTSPKRGKKGAATTSQVAVVQQDSTVPVVTGLPSSSRKSKDDGFTLQNVVIIGRLEDGTAVKMGTSTKGGFGFQIGDGRAKYAMGAKWLTICALAGPIQKYVLAHSK